MNKISNVLGVVLFVFVSVYPVGRILFHLFGYAFKFADSTACVVFSVIAAAVSVFSVVVFFFKGERPTQGTVCVLLSLAAPLSIINAVLCIDRSADIWVTASMFICCTFCIASAAMNTAPKALKTVCIILCAVMALPAIFLSMLFLMLGEADACNTVTQSVMSPNGARYAEVIDNDQGALGGATIVEVYESRRIRAVCFDISKEPQRVYRGRWGEFDGMEIYWKDSNCLVINAKEYEVG